MTMVRYKISNYYHFAFMYLLNKLFYIIPSSKIIIDIIVISNMISVILFRLIEWSEHYTLHSERLNVIKHLYYTPNISTIKLPLLKISISWIETVYHYVIYRIHKSIYQTSFSY